MNIEETCANLVKIVNEWGIGRKVKCIKGRHIGHVGYITYWNPEGHDDAFCMRVEPEVNERVNPANWEKEPNIILPVCPVDADGRPLRPNKILL